MNNICNNINYITDSLSGNFYDTGCFHGCYSLEQPLSGFIIKNSLHPIENQYYMSGSTLVINESLGLGIISPNPSVNFSGDQKLKIFKNITGSNFSIFVDFNLKKSTLINSGELRDLMSLQSKSSGEDRADFNLKLNNYNDLFVIYSGIKSGISFKTITKSDIALDSSNILSFNILQSQISLGKFNFYTDSIESTPYSFDLEISKNISFGSLDFSSFDGSINNIMLFDNFLNTSAARDIAKTFLKTGEREEVFVETIYIASGEISPTYNAAGIIGTGITGYKNIYNDVYIPNNLNYNFKVYSESGVTGIITGEIMEYNKALSGIDVASLYRYNLYDLNHSVSYLKNNLIFLSNLEDTDLVEIQIYSSFSHLKTGMFIQDRYINLEHQNYKNNIHINGLYTKTFISGNLINIDENIPLNGLDIFNNLKIFNNFVDLDNYYYSYNGLDYQSINGWKLLPTNENLNKKYNIYLNGVKLLEDLDYKILFSSYNNKNQIYFPANGPVGDLAILEDIYLDRITGYWGAIKDNINNISGRKIVWTNGLLQSIDLDYQEYAFKNISGIQYTVPNQATSFIFNDPKEYFNKNI